MATYVCTRKCYAGGRIYKDGELVTDEKVVALAPDWFKKLTATSPEGQKREALEAIGFTDNESPQDVSFTELYKAPKPPMPTVPSEEKTVEQVEEPNPLMGEAVKPARKSTAKK